jgi:hypothetical protein
MKRTPPIGALSQQPMTADALTNMNCLFVNSF